MRRVASALVFCAGLFPALSAVAAEAQPEPATQPETKPEPESKPQTGWHDEFEAAKAEADRLKLPLLIHFHAAWCGPCRKMESGVLNTPEVLAACGTKCVAVKVDFDERQEIAAKYGVAALPTDVFVSPEGDVLGKSVGPATRDTYLARIDGVGAKCSACGKADPEQDVFGLLTRIASAGGIGLDGYSPVSLASGKVWREGSPEFVWRHAGVIYFLADAEELAAFKADPEKYAPKFSGFDPVVLSTEGVAVPGEIAYGSFYEGRLHLHATQQSRSAFLKAPAEYPAPKEIQVPAAIARGPAAKPPVEAAPVSLMMGS